MKLTSFQVDAFTDKVFCGNPASVVILEKLLSDEVLKKISQENSVPETAFILKESDGFNLRWFTPDIEMDLCGHATLASAHVLFNELGYAQMNIKFYTASGVLNVKRDGDCYCLDFPLREASPATLPEEIYDSLNIKPIEVYKSRDYMLVYNSQKEIEEIVVDRSILDEINLGTGGVIATAKGDDCDFVSRFFTPQSTILEDPVTGSAHCTLAPYWSQKMNKNTLNAKQLSLRGGNLTCQILGERLILIGKAVTYSKSQLNIEV